MKIPRDMKVLKKARDNDNTALINPAKSSGGREIIPKFSNYDVRARRYPRRCRRCRGKTDRHPRETRMQATLSSDIARCRRREGWLECNPLRVGRAKCYHRFLVRRTMPNCTSSDDAKCVERASAHTPLSQSLNLVSFTSLVSGLPYSNLAERTGATGTRSPTPPHLMSPVCSPLSLLQKRRYV